MRGWNVTVSDDATDESLPLARAFRDVLIVTRAAQQAANVSPIGPVTIEAAADLPPGGGLGCSAALGVAVARALDPSASSDAIAVRVNAWERVFHGNPSGIDGAVASLGGCVLFQRSPTAGEAALHRARARALAHPSRGRSQRQASSTKSMVEAVASARSMPFTRS